MAANNPISEFQLPVVALAIERYGRQYCIRYPSGNQIQESFVKAHQYGHEL
jgi:hypothetical protein